MKNGLVRSAISVAMVGMLICPVMIGQTSGNVNATMQRGRMARSGRNERHPAIRSAIGALNRAKGEMQRASHDFGGHREDAIKACDEAIIQLKQALAYDKK